MSRSGRQDETTGRAGAVASLAKASRRVWRCTLAALAAWILSLAPALAADTAAGADQAAAAGAKTAQPQAQHKISPYARASREHPPAKTAEHRRGLRLSGRGAQKANR